MALEIDTFNFAFPDLDWPTWIVGEGIESVADDVATRHADGPDAVAVVRRSLIALNADALAKGPLSVQMAIWVPDRSTGEGVAVLDAFKWGFAPGAEVSAEAFVARRNVKKDMGRGTKVFDYDVKILDVPAGEAVVEAYTMRRRREATIQGYILFSIFPPGSTDAFCLQLNTVHLGLMKELGTQSRIIANSVELTLWDAPA
jgi:hypothetical protein